MQPLWSAWRRFVAFLFFLFFYTPLQCAAQRCHLSGLVHHRIPTRSPVTSSRSGGAITSDAQVELFQNGVLSQSFDTTGYYSFGDLISGDSYTLEETKLPTNFKGSSASVGFWYSAGGILAGTGSAASSTEISDITLPQRG